MNNKVSHCIKKLFNSFMFVLVLFLSACTGSSTPTPELTVNTVTIYAEPDANQNSAIAVDLVLIYSQDLLKTIGQMSARTYFASSKQLLLDNPTLLDIWHWELVPGQIVQNFEPPQEKGDSFGAYIFANYVTPGDHRVRIAPDGIVNILLMKDDLKNLSALSAKDIQRGTTMTDPSCWGDSSESDLKKGEIPRDSSAQGIFRLGPTMNVTQPCKRRPPCISRSQNQGPFTFSSDGRPLPIVATPLAPLTMSSPRKHKSKVIKWHN